MAKKYHPDLNQGNKQAEGKMVFALRAVFGAITIER